MKRRKTNIKIVHHNYNLYNRRKSKGKQVLAVIVTILAAAALCVVGYGIGKPVLEYFQSLQSADVVDSGSAWTPPSTEEITGEAGTVTADGTETVLPTEEAAEEVVDTSSVYVLSDSAASSSDSLNSAIAAAKNSGATAVTVTLKDSTGYFLYKSAVDGIKDSEAINGSLTAKQICDIITKAGLTPVAKINTLKDHISPNYVDGIRYETTDGWAWHDDYVESGGKVWVSPFNSQTALFFREICAEISEAGFKQIILTNTIYPEFHPTDYTLLSDISDESKRLTALWNVISAANSGAQQNGAELLLEMTDDSLFASEKLSTDAEAAGNKDLLKSVTVLANYTGTNSYVEAKSFIGRMSATYPGQKYAVIVSGGFSDNALTDVKKAFGEADIAVFSG
jgi:hypothetical protein